MLRGWFESVVLSLTGTILQAHQPPTSEEALRVATFIREQHARLPDFLRVPLLLLTLLFDVWPVLRLRGWFHGQTLQRREAQVLAWKSSRRGPCRDLLKFYESLAVFGWFSEFHASHSSVGPERT